MNRFLLSIVLGSSLICGSFGIFPAYAEDDEGTENTPGESVIEQDSTEGPSATAQAEEPDASSQMASDTAVTPIIETDKNETTVSASPASVASEVSDPIKNETTASSYTCETDDGKISVSAIPEDGTMIPEDTKLSVQEIGTDNPQYEAYASSLITKLQEEGNETEGSVLLYDISFISNDGQETEPSGPVDVKIDFKDRQLSDDLNIVESNDLEVVHLPLKEGTDPQNDISSSDIDPQVVNADTSLDTDLNVSFTLNSFSVTGIAGIRKAPVQQQTETINGTEYTVYQVNGGFSESNFADPEDVTHSKYVQNLKIQLTGDAVLKDSSGYGFFIGKQPGADGYPKNVILDLNGHTLTMNDQNDFFQVSENGTLTIQDNGSNGTIKNYTTAIQIKDGGIVNMEGGTIDGSAMKQNPQQGGAVLVGSSSKSSNSTFNMTGGRIVNCKASEGGAVYIDQNKATATFNGKNKITIKDNTASNKGGAIYNNGTLNMQGILDIDGIVYLQRNNFSGLDSVDGFINVTGHLLVVGDGVIDVDTNYPTNGNNSSYATSHKVYGNTVVENATQTESGYTAEQKISREEFYTYASYFINSTRGLGVHAGFDPGKNNTTAAAGPSNWFTSNSDDHYDQTYVDVMGQTMLVNAVGQPGSRQSQDYDYLIYSERQDTSVKEREFYSVKLIKQDSAGNTLNGAQFSLSGTAEQNNPYMNDSKTVTGTSGTTGEDTGVNAGETYIYTSAAHNQKLMIDDGTYTIKETNAPEGYQIRDTVATLKITHETDTNNVSVSVVYANETYKLTTEVQTINQQYKDKGNLVQKEIVLTIVNANEPVEQPYTLAAIKQDTNGKALAGAAFTLKQNSISVASANSTDDGTAQLLKAKENNSAYELIKGTEYTFSESPPEGYEKIDDLSVKVADDGTITIGNGTMTNNAIAEQTVTNGSWSATVNDNHQITITVKDNAKPVLWTLQGIKYGTQAITGNELYGAQFSLYEGDTLKETVTSRDGSSKGSLTFKTQLEQGKTYLLHEVRAPDGYTLAKDITISIPSDETTPTVKQGDADIVTSDNTATHASIDTTNHVITIAITDEAVYELPQSGRNGIYGLMAMGILVMCITLSGMVILRRYER